MARAITVPLLLMLVGPVWASPVWAPKVDAVFAGVDKTSSPGCAVGVYRGGRVVYARGYGMANLNHGIAIQPNFRFHVASISKQFAAASVVLLAQQGKLSFDDPVRRYIPELGAFAQSLTIRHLLHHTSGLRDQWSQLIFAGWRLGEDPVRDEDVMDLVGRMRELNFPPGDRYLYSNTGYTLLARIVARVSGKTFRQFTTESIFQPLGMDSTFFRDDHHEIVTRIANGHGRRPDGFRNLEPQYDTTGASSLLTTVEDLAKWDANFARPVIGGVDFPQTMLTEFRLLNGKTIPYRFGLQVGSYRGAEIVEHSGGDAGYSAHFMRLPGKDLSVACLCNHNTNATGLARQVVDAVIGAELEPKTEEAKPVAPVKVAVDEMAKWIGLYHEPATERTAWFFVRDGRLTGRVEGREYLLDPASGDTYRVKDQPVQIRFSEGGLTEQNTANPSGDPRSMRKADRAQPTPAELESYAGDYYSPELDVSYRVAFDKDNLVVLRKKARRDVLAPTLKDGFFTGELGYLRFDRDSSGEISGFRLWAGRVLALRFTKTRPQPQSR